MEEIESLLQALNRAPASIVTGAGILLGALALSQLASFRSVLLVIGGVFFLSSIGAPESGAAATQWLYPIQSQRAVLILLAGTMLFLSIGAHAGRVLGRPWPLQGFLLLLLGTFAGLMRLLHEGPGAGLVSILFAGLTILPLLVVIAALVEDWADILTLLRTLVFTNVIWIIGVAVQYRLDPGMLVKGNEARFQGLLTNPQHAAVYVALTTAVALWLGLNDPKQRYRTVWLAVAATNVLLLLWTGSRTGFGIIVIGATVAFYGRIGRTILLAPVAAGLFFVGQAVMTAAGIDLTNAGRLTSLEDTRSAAWLDLYESFADAPLTGQGITELNASENSYLYGMAAYGIGMGLLILVLVIASAVMVMKLWRIRRWCSDQSRGVIDLVIAFNGMYFAGAFLEGYLLARVSSTLVLFIVFAGIGSRILRAARTDPGWLIDGDGTDELDPEADVDFDPEWPPGSDPVSDGGPADDLRWASNAGGH